MLLPRLRLRTTRSGSSGGSGESNRASARALTGYDWQLSPQLTVKNTYSNLQNMKTSLSIDDSLYEDAKKASQRTGQTISAIISEWARLGRRVERQRARQKPTLAPVDLGRPLMNFDSRDAVSDALDDDRARY